MTGVQRFLSGHKNHIRGAVFDGPVKPITDAVLQRAIPRQGSSSGKVTGTYVGKEQAEYEIEILDTITANPPVTQPIFAGAGNGTMEDIVATGLSARTVTVELTDLGTQLMAAGADFLGVRIRARTPGAAGNALSLKIDRSALVITPQNFSLLQGLVAGSTSVIGPQYDWNAVVLGPDNIVPSDAKRIVFGGDLGVVYTQYKKFEDGQWVYHFEPSIKANVPEETQIGFVTGLYTVRLFDGAAEVEVYANVRTLYDLMDKIRTTSTLLVVEGAIGKDQSPNGNHVTDLQVRTDAYVSLNSGVGSRFATGFTNVSIDPTAGTQLVTAECTAAKPADAFGAGLGSEIWRVRSSIAGDLGNFRSGDIIRGADFTAQIPRKVPTVTTSEPQGEFDLVRIDYNESARTPDPENPGSYLTPLPGICVDGRTLGSNASSQQITLTYVKRPPVDNCSCQEQSFSLNPVCLGIEPTDPLGGFPVSYSAPTVTRLVALYDWLAETVRNNSSYIRYDGGILDPGAPGGGMGVTTGAGSQDPFVSNPAPGSASFISKIDPVAGTIQTTPFLVPSLTSYQKKSLFDLVGLFETTIAELDKLGAGAYKTAGEDAWDAGVAEFQGDVDTYMTGGALTPETLADAGEDLEANDLVVVIDIAGVLSVRKAISHPAAKSYGFVLEDYLEGVEATVHNLGELTVDFMSEPAGPCADTATFATEAGKIYRASTCKPGRVSSAAEIDLISGPRLYALTSGVAPYKLYMPPTSSFAMVGLQLLTDRYEARVKHILISAGISPLGKSEASTDGGGDGCWQDSGDAFYWKVEGSNGGTYAPAFNNTPYYSSKKAPGGSSGAMGSGYQSTKEFGFYLRIPCPQHLRAGDTVVLQIGSAGSTTPLGYQRGDTLTLGIVAAQNIGFKGGQDGNNIQTWYVRDNVDGPRPSYALDTDVPVPYNTGGLEFLITQGTIPYKVGDRYEFSIEGGHFRWRKYIGGVASLWSADVEITTAPEALDDGLSLQFFLGSSPAFFAGDIYRFLALQPHALSNVVKPDFDSWQWGAVNPAVMTIDLGSIKDIEAIGLAFHSIPEGAVVQVAGGDAGPGDWVEPLVWHKDVMAQLLAAPRTARFLELTIVGAVTGGVGYLFIGEVTTFTNSAQVSLNREYRIKRSSGEVNPYAHFQGKSVGGSVQWPEGHLAEEDYVPMVAMLDWLKMNDDEPLLFFPQSTRADEIVLASCESDSIIFNDVFNFQPDAGRVRRLSCNIPLRGVAFT